MSRIILGKIFPTKAKLWRQLRPEAIIQIKLIRKSEAQQQKQEEAGMGYIQDSLIDGEEVKELFAQHWFAKIPMVVLFILSVPTLGFLLIFAIPEWLHLRTLEYGLTSRRVVYKRGIIRRKTEEMKISSIETVEIDQGIFGRIFGFGTVKVTGRGISDVVFSVVDDPIAVKKKIESVIG
jgi:hypothetical protein